MAQTSPLRSEVFAGTSGYAYAGWKGALYPKDLPASRMLGFYAERLPAVEINATFYRRPARAQVEAWAAATPPGFVFAFKASRYFSAGAGLRDPAAIRAFFDLLASDRLGPVLFALPHLKKDVALLRDFLAVAAPHRTVLDLAHPSWRGDDVHQLLADHDVALCVTEDEERATPVVATGSWGYVRLRKPAYDRRALARWAERLHTTFSRSYVFFKHETTGPAAALALIRASAGSAPSPKPR